MAYQRPMVMVDQNMTITPTSIERDQPAFIFGPNYELHRYSDPEEKPKVKLGEFKAGKTLSAAYPGVIDDKLVDKDYTKMFGDNVVVKLEDLGDAILPEKNDPQTEKIISGREINGGFTKLFFPDKNYIDRYPAGSSSPGFDGIPVNVAVGDRLLIKYIDQIGVDSTAADPTSSSPEYEYRWTQIYSTVTAVEYSKDGHDIWNYGDSESGVDTGAGTLITIEDAIPESVNEAKSVQVTVVDVLNNVEFTRKNLAEERPYPFDDENNHIGKPWPRYQWTQELIVDPKSGGTKRINGVVVHGELHVEVYGYFQEPQFCDVLSADLYLTYRELNTAFSDTFHSVTGASEVANMLGTVDPDNPLAMGVYMAALNSATDDGDEAPPIYFMAIPEPGINGYNAVLNKATTNTKAYVFAPTTQDDEVLEAVRAHVLDMSTKQEKQWRIAAGSSAIPRDVNRLDHLLDPQGDEFLAIPVSADGSIVPNNIDGQYNTIRIVRAEDDLRGNVDTKLRSTVVVGDRVRFGYHKNDWDEWTFDTYVITKVINNYTVEVDVEDMPRQSINTLWLDIADSHNHYVPSKVEIFHTYTAAESADLIASVSRFWMTRRMLNVFPSVFSNNGVTMSGEFAACAVAGLISATEPQQPITNMTVRGIDNIPLTYQTYNKYELDTIASGGTFIVTQDFPNDLVYVRHQITTAYSEGNLNTAELSITKNVDHISYAFAELFRPYYGRYNITPDLIATFRNLAGQLLDQLGSGTSIYGPQVILENTEIRYVRQNELMKDHVDIGITLGVPYPCNVIDIVLTV